MKRTRHLILFVLAAVLWAVPPAWAQRVLASTTTSAAVTQTTQVIPLTATTNIAVGDLIYVDRELMQVNAKTTTQATVTRGVQGTQPMAHSTSEQVLVMPSGADWHATDPDFGALCLRGTGQAAVSPWVNVRTGTIWNCLNPTVGSSASSTWNATNTMLITYNSVQNGTQ